MLFRVDVKSKSISEVAQKKEITNGWWMKTF